MFEVMAAIRNLAEAVSSSLQQAYALVGPVAPFLLGIGILEGVLLLFLLALVLLVSQRRIQSERGFMIHLRKGNGALSNVAIVVGFIGTYLGLMDVLPVLAKIVEGKAAQGTTSNLLAGLSSAFVSSMVGLGLGGVLGSINGYLLDVAIPRKEESSVRGATVTEDLDRPDSGAGSRSTVPQNGERGGKEPYAPA